MQITCFKLIRAGEIPKQATNSKKLYLRGIVYECGDDILN